MDKLECKALRRQVVEPAGSYESKVSKFLSSFKISRKIKQIRRSLIAKAATTSKCLNKLDARRVYSREKMINHSFVGTAEVFGRDVDKENITNLLIQPNDVKNENVSLICIVGAEGMGKTTLAKLVYGDEMMDEQFQLKLWVRVPEDFCRIRLMKEFYSSATGKDYEEVEVNDLQSRLEQILSGQKFFLVLDHVLNYIADTWDCLKDMLLKGASGSKVLVTTRREQVAAMMGAVHSYLLNRLSHEDSMSLFVKAAFRDGAESSNGNNLITIGEDIVRQCGGIPLVVKTVGTLLRQNSDKSHWSSIKNDIRSLHQEGNNILPALKLSYAHLPSHLRRCFAYCSLFPKGYRFNSDCLVSYWMAIGFLATLDKNEELEDVGLLYLKQLLSRCFFQDVEDHGYYFTFKMHDIMHDLAEEVAKRECKTVDLRIGYDDIIAQHLSILAIGDSDRKNTFNSRNMRTIIMQRLEFQSSSQSFINECMSNFKYLRLLCLSGLAFEKLPDSIGALAHLRFLDLSWNLIMQELSESICELQSLQTLRLLGCSALQKLPSSMRNMISLRHLEITTKKRHLTQNGIECLSSLRYLKLRDCHNLESLPDRIGCITSLRTLILQDCRGLISLPGSIKYLRKLEKLVIYSCPKLNLKMDLQGEELCFSLKVFMIYELERLVSFPELILQGSSSTIEYMRIEACRKLQALPAWFENLTSLQKLEIINCPRMSSLPNGMGNLRTLILQGCHGLISLARCFKDLQRLEKLVIHSCPKLNLKMDLQKEELRFNLKVFTICDLEGLVDFPQLILQGSASTLEYMRIEKCPNLQALPNWLGNLTSLQKLEILSCPRLSSLPKGMRNLRTLVLQGCQSMISLPYDCTKYLKKLEKLVIRSCSRLNLQMDLEGEEGLRLNLRVFMIYDLQRLVELPQLILQGSANTLEYLRIEACPKLTALPAWFANLIALQKLEIVKCPKLLRPPYGMQNLTALRELNIQKSPTLSGRCRKNLPNIISHVREIHLDSLVASSMDNE